MAKKRSKSQELDSVYFLKIVLYVIIGSQWIYLTNSTASTQIPVPLGLILGLWFAAHEHFQIDRKIEYALILIASVIGFWAQTGFYIKL